MDLIPAAIGGVSVSALILIMIGLLIRMGLPQVYAGGAAAAAAIVIYLPWVLGGQKIQAIEQSIVAVLFVALSSFATIQGTNQAHRMLYGRPVLVKRRAATLDGGALEDGAGAFVLATVGVLMLVVALIVYRAFVAVGLIAG